jgi:hypothetical protein
VGRAGSFWGSSYCRAGLIGGTMGAMTDRASARAAKSALSVRLAADPGVVGVGVARGESGYVVKVNLADAHAASRVPGNVDGVRVVTEVVGAVRAS